MKRLAFAALLLAASLAYADTPPATTWTTGMLCVPFKFHLSDKTISGGSTVGAYIGRQYDIAGMLVTPIVASGFSAGSTGSVGASAATGVLGSPYGSSVNFGLVLGADWFGKGSGAYEGKPWLAFEIGYKFGK